MTEDFPIHEDNIQSEDWIQIMPTSATRQDAPIVSEVDGRMNWIYLTADQLDKLAEEARATADYIRSLNARHRHEEESE